MCLEAQAAVKRTVHCYCNYDRRATGSPSACNVFLPSAASLPRRVQPEVFFGLIIYIYISINTVTVKACNCCRPGQDDYTYIYTVLPRAHASLKRSLLALTPGGSSQGLRAHPACLKPLYRAVKANTTERRAQPLLFTLQSVLNLTQAYIRDPSHRTSLCPGIYQDEQWESANLHVARTLRKIPTRCRWTRYIRQMVQSSSTSSSSVL